MMFVTVGGGMRRVLLIHVSVSDDSGSVANQVSTSYRPKVRSCCLITLFTWSLSSWYERRIAVNTAIPDAASGSQRSSHTRRDASTTSNGAAWKPITEGYGHR